MRKRFIVKKELADHLRCSVRTIDNWMREELIPYYKVGGTVRFDPEKVDRALEKFERKPRHGA